MSEQNGICNLVEALAAQEIDATVFLPFTILCLAENVSSTEAHLTIRIVDKEGTEHVERLEIHWALEDIPVLPPAVQSHTITEWGALGTVCAVLHRLGNGLRLTSVAHEGDRFDYWVGDTNLEWGLEISGTQSGSLLERHEEKVQQLLSNPYRVDGFVIVVRFASKEVWFTFHEVE